ncbi:hypothetical protein GCM10025857_23440 [Alicyclobacillus contaminans]|nr:hypothetical protein GCM10025857_23440 [Alicyclobacillus contaminans]
MLRGLTAAASGMLADERLQQALANNLANSETPGFKATSGALMSFPEQLEQLLNYGQNGGGQAIGKLGTGVAFQEGVPLFSEGQLQQTNRNLDVAVVDTTPVGTYAAVAGANGLVSQTGTIGVGAQGRLSVNGQPLAVIGPDGQAVQGVYAVRNPAYQGTSLYAADGKPDWDAAGNPSYVFENAAGQVLGAPGQPGFENWGVRIGTQDDMGLHSFFPVAYQSPEGNNGIAVTRDGHFDVTANNILVDASGNAVLPVNAQGQPLVNARIQINPQYQGTDLFGPNGGR